MSDDWTVSASKIKSFEECEEAFRLEYIEGHREEGPDNRYLRRGNAVHEATEDLLRPFVDDDREVRGGSDLLKAAYRANGGKRGYRLDDEFHNQVLASLDAIDRFIRKHVDEVRGVELEVEFGVAGLSRDFGGFMDLATGTDVVDWKTGKSEGKAAEEAIQGAVYMGGYAYEFGEAPEAIHFVYCNPETGDDHPKVRTIEPDDEVWDEMVAKARRLLRAVETGEFTPTPTDKKCHWCEQSVHCAADLVGAGNIDYWSYP